MEANRKREFGQPFRNDTCNDAGVEVSQTVSTTHTWNVHGEGSVEMKNGLLSKLIAEAKVSATIGGGFQGSKTVEWRVAESTTNPPCGILHYEFFIVELSGNFWQETTPGPAICARCGRTQPPGGSGIITRALGTGHDQMADGAVSEWTDKGKIADCVRRCEEEETPEPVSDGLPPYYPPGPPEEDDPGYPGGGGEGGDSGYPGSGEEGEGGDTTPPGGEQPDPGTQPPTTRPHPTTQPAPIPVDPEPIPVDPEEPDYPINPAEPGDEASAPILPRSRIVPLSRFFLSRFQ